MGSPPTAPTPVLDSISIAPSTRVDFPLPWPAPWKASTRWMESRAWPASSQRRCARAPPAPPAAPPASATPVRSAPAPTGSSVAACAYILTHSPAHRTLPSGVPCSVGSTSSCAYVANTAYQWFCPNSLGSTHIAADSVEVDPVSSLPCYTTGTLCASAASNPCIAPVTLRLAGNGTYVNRTAGTCTDGSDTLCAFTSGNFNWCACHRAHRDLTAAYSPHPAIS